MNIFLLFLKNYNLLMEQLEDYELGMIVKIRQSEKSKTIEVSIDDL